MAPPQLFDHKVRRQGLTSNSDLVMRTIATIVTKGVLNSVRSANLRLGIMVNE